MRDNAVERLLSLFTSSDRATAIAGDLAEEQERRGWLWFWLHVATVTFALWRKAATDAPLRLFALVLTGLALLSAAALGGLASLFLFPDSMGSIVGWIPLPFFWWGGAFWTGASLVFLAPRRGMAACAMLAVAGGALVMVFAGPAVWRDPANTDFVVLCAIGLAAVAPLLLGGAIAHRRMAVYVLGILLVVATPASPQQTEWTDPSPHMTRLVDVEDGVSLEVLDWGGSGPALVLLAGLGGTAHHYDDFAPALTARYRVVGVTRRGHRGSSAAAGGYGFVRLAEDVLRVIDAMGINNPVVIGHSFAGEEMHVLGARHGAKIRGLVYIDAAFDRGDDADDEAYAAVARTIPASSSPQAADLASFTALRTYLEKHGGAGPEAWLRTRYRTNADGSVGGAWVPDISIRQATMKEIQAAYKPYNPERIRVPALAIYAAPKSADDLMQHGSSDRSASPELAAKAVEDPAIRERVEELFLLTRERVCNHAKWFETFAEGGRVVEISGTHSLIISSPREVLEHIEAFISSLQGKR